MWLSFTNIVFFVPWYVYLTLVYYPIILGDWWFCVRKDNVTIQIVFESSMDGLVLIGRKTLVLLLFLTPFSILSFRKQGILKALVFRDCHRINRTEAELTVGMMDRHDL